MKKSRMLNISKFLLATSLAMIVMTPTIPVSALEYTESDMPAGVFATATSVDPVITIGGNDSISTNLSSTTAVTPPPFGYGDMTATQTTSATTTYSTSSYTATSTTIPDIWDSVVTSTGYTQVTSSLYTSNGTLGTLSIPSIGLQVAIYEGTDDTALAMGTGHFSSTSIWDGNVALAGHNRGVTNHFGEIHTLDVGDKIKLQTTLGTREYEVYSVRMISSTDVSILSPSNENIITLVTCVMDNPDYRWCVQAIEK